MKLSINILTNILTLYDFRRSATIHKIFSNYLTSIITHFSVFVFFNLYFSDSRKKFISKKPTIFVTTTTTTQEIDNNMCERVKEKSLKECAW